MAIAPGLPGLQVTVAVAGEALPEYDYDNDEGDHVERRNATSKYLEAPSGAEFEITTLYTAPYPPLPIHVDIMLDGDYIQAPWEEWYHKDGCEGYKYGQAASMIEGQSYTQSFQFAELKTEEIDQPATEEAKRQVSSIGQIVVYLYYTKDLEKCVPKEVPTSTLSHHEAISQKALKATVTPGDSLTYKTSLSKPKQRELASYHQVKTTQNEPFATFVFYYRSTHALKSLGLIARTPSPSPEPEPVLKDLDDMNAEELRAELLRRRNEEEQATRVKREREREDSEATLVDEDNDDVEYDRSEPARKRSKPGPGVKVIELE